MKFLNLNFNPSDSNALDRLTEFLKNVNTVAGFSDYGNSKGVLILARLTIGENEKLNIVYQLLATALAGHPSNYWLVKDNCPTIKDFKIKGLQLLNKLSKVIYTAAIESTDTVDISDYSVLNLSYDDNVCSITLFSSEQMKRLCALMPKQMLKPLEQFGKDCTSAAQHYAHYATATGFFGSRCFKSLWQGDNFFVLEAAPVYRFKGQVLHLGEVVPYIGECCYGASTLQLSELFFSKEGLRQLKIAARLYMETKKDSVTVVVIDTFISNPAWTLEAITLIKSLYPNTVFVLPVTRQGVDTILIDWLKLARQAGIVGSFVSWLELPANEEVISTKMFLDEPLSQSNCTITTSDQTEVFDHEAFWGGHMTKFRLSIDYRNTIEWRYTTLNDKPAVEFVMVKYLSCKGVDTVTIATDILDKCCARVESALKIIQPGEGIVVHTSGETPVSLVFEKLAWKYGGL